jgi:hypothetical protein
MPALAGEEARVRKTRARTNCRGFASRECQNWRKRVVLGTRAAVRGTPMILE